MGYSPKGFDVIAKYGKQNVRGLVERVDRYNFDTELRIYKGCMEERTRNNEYVDMHCWRPYEEQVGSMLDVLSFAWGDDIHKVNEELNEEGVLQ